MIWTDVAPPAAAKELWPALVSLLLELQRGNHPPADEIARNCRLFTVRCCLRCTITPLSSSRDLEQAAIFGNLVSRSSLLLSELAADPPTSTQHLAPPDLEEDYLVLSTIHSAKGLEWDVVFIPFCSRWMYPIGVCEGDPEQMEEERRFSMWP